MWKASHLATLRHLGATTMSNSSLHPRSALVAPRPLPSVVAGSAATDVRSNRLARIEIQPGQPIIRVGAVTQLITHTFDWGHTMSNRYDRTLRTRRVASLAASLLVACSNPTESNPTERPSVSSIRISPQSVALAVGDSVQLFAQALDAVGQPLTSPAVGWRSVDLAVATVNHSGRVAGVAVGATEIEAMAGGRTARVHVDVGEDLGTWLLTLGALTPASHNLVGCSPTATMTVTLLRLDGKLLGHTSTNTVDCSIDGLGSQSFRFPTQTISDGIIDARLGVAFALATEGRGPDRVRLGFTGTLDTTAAAGTTRFFVYSTQLAGRWSAMKQ